jgi:hypothetical protein
MDRIEMLKLLDKLEIKLKNIIDNRFLELLLIEEINYIKKNLN